MRKIIAGLLALFTAAAFAGPNDILFTQRNSTDDGAFGRYPTIPAGGANGLMFFNGSTVLPGYLLIGSGLSVSSGTLSASGGPTIAYPTSRSFGIGTAYQCTDNTRPCQLTITLQSSSSVSLSGTVNNEGAITIGSTTGVTSGTGIDIATYKNDLGGTLVVGLNLSSLQANSYTVAMPIGAYLAIRQTTGTGMAVVSTFEQTIN